jgi:hypothetical protein
MEQAVCCRSLTTKVIVERVNMSNWWSELNGKEKAKLLGENSARTMHGVKINL